MGSFDGWLEVGRGTVGPEHIDYNGHMNVVRSSPLPPDILAATEALEAAQAQLPPPPDLGRVIAP